MKNINKLREFYEDNKDCDSLTVSLKESDIFAYIEEILQFTEHKKLKCVRDLGRWTLYFSK